MDEEKYPGERRERAARRFNAAVGVVVVIAAALAAYLYWQSHASAPPPAPAVPSDSAPLPVVDAGEVDAGEAPPPPPGADEDTELHRAAGGLSNRPEWAAWLGEPHLIGRLVAATHRVAEGESPRPVLPFLAPGKPFSAVQREGQILPSPDVGGRWDAAIAVVTSIPPARAAAAYVRLEPYFQAAYREIAHPGERFRAELHRAVHVLLETPVPPAEPALTQSGETFFFADPGLEKLPSAQKQLLRLGVANARKLQAWLTQFADALPR